MGASSQFLRCQQHLTHGRHYSCVYSSRLDQGLVDEFIHEVIWLLLLVVRQGLAARLKPGHSMLAVALEGVAAMENTVVVQQDHVTLLEGLFDGPQDPQEKDMF